MLPSSLLWHDDRRDDGPSFYLRHPGASDRRSTIPAWTRTLPRHHPDLGRASCRVRPVHLRARDGEARRRPRGSAGHAGRRGRLHVSRSRAAPPVGGGVGRGARWRSRPAVRASSAGKRAVPLRRGALRRGDRGDGGPGAGRCRARLGRCRGAAGGDRRRGGGGRRRALAVPRDRYERRHEVRAPLGRRRAGGCGGHRAGAVRQPARGPRPDGDERDRRDAGRRRLHGVGVVAGAL